MELIPPPMLHLEVPEDYNASSATPCLFIHSIYVIHCLYIHSLSVMLSRISFHVLYDRESMCFSDFLACFQTFKTLCLLNYALMIRHDYDITSSLRIGALQDQLDWVNPEGQQCLHNLLQPLPLIPDNQGRRVIPFEHFINNDLEYLWGGDSSRKYTTSEPISYDKHALLGVSQKEDSEIWTIVENLDKQVEFHLDNDNVLWQDTRLVVPNDASLREALLTEAHSSPFSVKIEHQWASSLLQPLDIPVWK
uniref:Uncharacterized protein n=1 Tax=Tanacetum cinerariifolium TaxID=118510 RepID=A0A6L2KZS9_TANCI|nr:hypothetical protein [Tanacetum cinerariifolium]